MILRGNLGWWLRRQLQFELAQQQLQLGFRLGVTPSHRPFLGDPIFALRQHMQLWVLRQELSCGKSLTFTPGRTSCQGFSSSAFSYWLSRPLGVPTKYCTGGSLWRICSNTS